MHANGTLQVKLDYDFVNWQHPTNRGFVDLFGRLSSLVLQINILWFIYSLLSMDVKFFSSFFLCCDISFLKIDLRCNSLLSENNYVCSHTTIACSS